jgi:hypothetical protein
VSVNRDSGEKCPNLHPDEADSQNIHPNAILRVDIAMNAATDDSAMTWMSIEQLENLYPLGNQLIDTTV